MENPFKRINEKKQNVLETNDYLAKAIEEAENIIIPDEYRDNEGNLLSAPEGSKSKLENELHWKMVRTDSFKKWFGDWENDIENSSKIIDENGEPLLTYHATNHEIKELEPDHSNHFLTLGKGVYLTPDASISSSYGDKFYSCFLNVKKVIQESESGTDGSKFAKTLFYSLARPKDTALSSKFDEEDFIKKKLHGENNQFSVLHKENIMIVPSDIQNPSDTARDKEYSYRKDNWNSIEKN
jgi:hypothetical protein